MLNSHTTRQHELAPPWAPAGLAAADQLPDADAAARAADGIDAAAAQQQQQPCKGCAAADTSSAKMIMPPHGVKALANGRNMEDTFAAEALLAPSSALLPPHLAKKWPELALFGVFDGHGGVEVAAHAAARLPQHLGAALARQLLPLRSTAGTNPPRRQQPGGSGGGADRMMVTVSGGSCCSGESPRSSDGSSGSDGSGGSSGAGGSSAADSVACYSSARGGGGGGDNEDDDADGSPTSQAAAAAHGGGSGGGGGGNSTLGGAAAAVCEALRRAFAATDAELGGTEVGELVGSTAVVAAVGAAELFVAHAGDSRAVLCRKGVAVPLTLDHKPTRPDELARVTAAGGRVTTRGGTARVMGLLAMSRALGDQLLRGAGVVCDPEVAALPRGRDDELLLLATDGLWDVVGPQEAVNLALRSTMRARERGAGAAAACRVGASVLARAAVERGSRDNVTVLVVDLRRHAEGGASPGSVGAMLATTCSELLPHHHAPSRKRRSSSGSDAAAMGGGADAMAGAGAGAAAAACATPGCGCGGGAAGHRPAAVGGAAAAAIGHLPSLEERPERSPSPLPPPLKQQHQQAALPRHIQALESSLAAVAAAITGPRRGARRSSTGGSGGGSGGGVFNSLLTATTPAWPPAAATNAAAAAADATASVAAAYPRPLRLPATLSAPPPSARGGGAAPVVTTEPPSPAAAPESPPPACLLAPPPQSAAGAGASGTGVAGLRLWGGARTTSFTCVETGRVGFGLNCDEPQQPQPQLQPQPPATPMQPPLQPQQLAGLPPPAPAATAAGAGVGGGRPPRPPSHPGGGGF